MSKQSFSRFAGIVIFLFAVNSQVIAQSQTAALINVTDTFNFSVPSPDPTGVVFVPGSNSLFVADSEVNETVLFSGSNVFRTALDGGLLETFSTLDFTSEPAGITINPANGHLFISTDNAPRGVYEINPGRDGAYLNADDNITFFSTLDFGSTDPEGLTYNPLDGRLYIVDGVANRVSVVDPGANDLFDGVAPVGDDTVVAFDTSNPGIVDPEGIAYDEASDGLYIVGEPEAQLLHVNTAGEFVRLISLDSPLLRKPAGLALGPSSLANGAMSLFLVDRGVDNDFDPSENDGRLFEFALPPMPGNEAPVVTITSPVSGQKVVAPAAVTFSGIATDAEEGDLSAQLVWQSDLDGPVGRGAFFTSSRLSPGLHTITASVVDSTLAQSFTSVALRIYPVGSVVVETRIASSADDAEERGSRGRMALTSSDIELIRDKAESQMVGLRFTDVHIPEDAGITTAHIQFQVDEVSSELTILDIRAQEADDPSTFTLNRFDISLRPRTALSVDWLPSPWLTIGEAGVTQLSTDLSPLIQHIVSRDNWSPGNSLVFLIEGEGRRMAEAFDGDASAGAQLSVTYTMDNLAPVVRTSNDLSLTVGEAAHISGRVEDDGRGSKSGKLTTVWSQAQGSGIALFGDPYSLSTTVEFDTSGTYTLILSASDGELSAYDEINVTVEPSRCDLAPYESAGPGHGAMTGETVTDDALPDSGAATSSSRGRSEGPADAVFDSAGSVGSITRYSQDE